MTPHEMQRIADCIRPAFPPCPSDPDFLFGTRHGVPAFRTAAHALDKIPRYLAQGALEEIA
jgi:hypothetical protein